MPAVGKILIGAMSGTSADGVDAAAVSISGSGTAMTANLLQFVHVDYPLELKQAIFMARAAKSVAWEDVAGLTARITGYYIEAVNRIEQMHRSRAQAIAAHGQTFFHEPPVTLQLLDPALLAARTGLHVVSDFRRADCAAGGQGAPLVPFADYVLFRDPEKNRVLLNIGGIANLTWLKAGGSIDDVIAFDTGPGNCVSDWLMRQHDLTGPGFDAGGERALKGTVNSQTVSYALDDPYVRAAPPKSTDTAEMLRLFERAESRLSDADRLKSTLSDRLATACSVTAATIIAAIKRGIYLSLKQPVHEVLVSGGGVENRALINLLRSSLDSMGVTLSILPDQMAQAKEALAFALLAAATLDGEPSNVPSVTGASRRVILGSITPKP